MAQNPVELSFVQGDTFSVGISWVATGSPSVVDLSGATITASLKKEYSDSTSLADFTITETDLPNGQFSISLSPVQTAALPTRRGSKITSFVFDVNIEFLDGTVKTPVYGYIKMQHEVTA